MGKRGSLRLPGHQFRICFALTPDVPTAVWLITIPCHGMTKDFRPQTQEVDTASLLKARSHQPRPGSLGRWHRLLLGRAVSSDIRNPSTHFFMLIATEPPRCLR